MFLANLFQMKHSFEEETLFVSKSSKVHIFAVVVVVVVQSEIKQISFFFILFFIY